MNWAILIPIIAQYGIPLAESLFKKWSDGSLPTLADFDELRALGHQTAADRVKALLVSKGIPLDSDKAKEFLALVQ